MLCEIKVDVNSKKQSGREHFSRKSEKILLNKQQNIVNSKILLKNQQINEFQ